VIVAVAAGKGGVGKSTTALNLAAALEGVVVDADLGMADLPGGRGPDLHDVLAGRAAPGEAVRAGDPALLPCGRTLAGARAADPRRLAGVLEAVEAECGTVVVDCPAGLAADVGVPLFAADRCVLVATPDVVAVPDVVRTRALAVELDAGLAGVVLNKAAAGDAREGAGGAAASRVRDLVGAPVTVVPRSDAVHRAQTAGVPVRAVAPESVAAARFVALADELAAP
jgi:septum site-determining protein MinD